MDNQTSQEDRSMEYLFVLKQSLLHGIRNNLFREQEIKEKKELEEKI